ncbi:DUF262 domain-containing protein [Methanococcoides sp. NM1]|uniref:DUF262 domain-containing protein n=1 Tax=Methanococcoides sp. NM1 TaxID=1201013 RepID=UPI0010831AEA|nr:DUF262 domain-containing protein [Methanococcoides sp. NM1]
MGKNLIKEKRELNLNTSATKKTIGEQLTNHLTKYIKHGVYFRYMPLQEEIDNTSREIDQESYSMSIGELISLYEEGDLDIHPEFQRVFRWNDLQKSRLIESLMIGIPVPSIFVSQRDNGVWDVIDGVQRLSTIFEFVGVFENDDGTIQAPSTLLKTKYLPSLEGKQWKGDEEVDNCLTATQKRDFKRARINIEIVKKQSDPNIKYDLFQRLNSLGTKLSDQELRNCYLIMLNKDLFNWLKDLGNYPPFLKCICLTENAISQQYHLELALRFFIFKNESLEELKKLNFAYLDEYLSKKMEEIANSPTFDKELEGTIFKNTFDLLNDTLGEYSFKKYDATKSKFGGQFLVSAFEAVAIGVGKNIDDWNSGNTEENKTELEKRIIGLWKNSDYIGNIGSGVDFYKRIPNIVPLGKEVFKKSEE